MSGDYGSAAFSAARGGSIGSVLRRSNPAAAEAASATAVELDSAATTVELDSAATTVRKFYDGFNRQDLASVEVLFAQNCVYEDLIFSKPFTGRKALLDFFKRLSDHIGPDLHFAIDDISEDASNVGVNWHLEWKGKPFPLGRGCSFYKLEVINGQRQIVFGRDALEPSIKPGNTALVAMRVAIWLLQNFPFLANRM